MRRATGKKVLVAMSGGVDSSVAAALLKGEGYEVVGCFMRLGKGGADNNDGACDASSGSSPRGHQGHRQGCCSVNDAGDARLVAAMLDIPLYVLNFEKDFGKIIDYFVGEYNRGRTPNPCIRCNDWLKFGKLAEFARSIEADYVASGHYARVERGPTRLLRGRDAKKDQSYVLFGTPIERLDHMLLPVGGLEKSQVRRIAAELGLPVSGKPDSQEICFVPDRDYAGLIRSRSPGEVRRGDILDSGGRVVGQHEGHQCYTIGQRRGLGVAFGYPIYVVGKDAGTNTITVAAEQDELLSRGLGADQTNWLIDPPGDGPVRCQLKIRYNGRAVDGWVRAVDGGKLEAGFEEPQAAVTPGQAVVCYQGERVLGGGWIREAR